MAQYEWGILLLIVLGFLVAELISVRRAIRRAKDSPPSPPAPGNTER